MMELHGSPLRDTDEVTGTVDLWCVDLQVGPALQAACAALLDAAEIERARRFVFERDRRRYVVHHAAARLLIARVAGLQPRRLRWSPGPHGRPAVSGADLAVSLSRSHERALVAVAAGGRIGVDIEADSGTPPAAEWLADHVDPAALARAAASGTADVHDWFYAAWTRVEALSKARGTGLGTDAGAPDARWDPWQAPTTLERTDDEGRPRRWLVQSLPLVADDGGATRYHAALASDRETAVLRQHVLDAAGLAGRLLQVSGEARLQA
jgi:4'-phosphopantetheinyl transferase